METTLYRNETKKEISDNVKTEIQELQKEINEISAQWRERIYGICEQLDYKGSSNFSYNVDRLNQFTKGLGYNECDHDFIPVNNDGKHKCRFCGEIEN